MFKFRPTLKAPNFGPKIQPNILAQNSGPNFRSQISAHNFCPKFRPKIPAQKFGADFPPAISAQIFGPRFRPKISAQNLRGGRGRPDAVPPNERPQLSGRKAGNRGYGGEGALLRSRGPTSQKQAPDFSEAVFTGPRPTSQRFLQGLIFTVLHHKTTKPQLLRSKDLLLRSLFDQGAGQLLRA